MINILNESNFFIIILDSDKNWSFESQMSISEFGKEICTAVFSKGTVGHILCQTVIPSHHAKAIKTLYVAA